MEVLLHHLQESKIAVHRFQEYSGILQTCALYFFQACTSSSCAALNWQTFAKHKKIELIRDQRTVAFVATHFCSVTAVSWDGSGRYNLLALYSLPEGRGEHPVAQLKLVDVCRS